MEQMKKKRGSKKGEKKWSLEEQLFVPRKTARICSQFYGCDALPTPKPATAPRDALGITGDTVVLLIHVRSSYVGSRTCSHPYHPVDLLFVLVQNPHRTKPTQTHSGRSAQCTWLVINWMAIPRGNHTKDMRRGCGLSTCCRLPCLP